MLQFFPAKAGNLYSFRISPRYLLLGACAEIDISNGSEMATATTDAFEDALSYALLCIGKQTLVLKKEQAEALKTVYSRSDAFVWLPTGYGKSICYECLPFLFDYKLGRAHSSASRSTVLVISPLISLMSDQVTSLRKRGVSAGIISSGDRVDKTLVAPEQTLLIPGKYSILFSSPEAIIGVSKWRDLLLSFPLSERVVAVAVDEVHCVSKW